MKIIKWFLIIVGVIVLGAAAALLIGRELESSKVKQIEANLLSSAVQSDSMVVDFDSLAKLPPPVERYFKYVLTDGQKFIRKATNRQHGTLRTSIKTENWSSFTARHLALPPAAGFIWNAEVEAPLNAHLRVLDSYIAGVGSGRVSLFSAFPVASDIGSAELNSGALHRYLAEAVWYPTALLPESGVAWTPIDDESAMAVLTSGGITVSLEFRFNQAGEVTEVYTPGRFGRFDGEYKKVPWEGHFRDYQVREGIRIPLYGEVGWYEDGMPRLVWKGKITEARYEFSP